MHFTREPILESIISARDGYKISVKRSSVLPNDLTPPEEYIVDSVELVSFRDSLFFRSLEKPKPFLLSVSQYELVEVKETRIVLKSATHEKSIKIGGGKEQHHKVAKEPNVETIVEEIGEEVGVASEDAGARTENVQHSVQQEPSRGDRKRDRRKRRRGREDRDWQDRSSQQHQAQASQPAVERAEGTAAFTSTTEEGVATDASLAPPVIPFATLIPPPTTLISETLSRYKEVMFGEVKGKETQEAPKEDAFIEIKEVIYEEKKPESDDNNASDEPLTRVRLDENYFDKGGFGSQY